MPQHPMKAQALSSSREKFKAITGHSGGGHSHAGGSHLKKAGKDGTLQTWSGHHKAHRHAEEHVHGGRCKPRADRRARGGRAAGGKTKDKDYKFPSLIEKHGPPTKEQEANKKHPQNPAPPENIGTDWYNRLSGRGDKNYRSGMSEADLKGILHGKRGGKMKRGGRARGGAGDDEDTPGGPLGGANARKEIAAGNKPYTPKREVPLKGWDEPGWST